MLKRPKIYPKHETVDIDNRNTILRDPYAVSVGRVSKCMLHAGIVDLKQVQTNYMSRLLWILYTLMLGHSPMFFKCN